MRLDEVSLGISPQNEKESTTVAVIITPSQKKSSSRRKIRKKAIRKREAKIDRCNRPKGQREEDEVVQEEKVENSDKDISVKNLARRGNIYS